MNSLIRSLAGHAPASFLLSTILLTGLDSVPKDLSRAIPLLTTAAQAGLAVAQHNLAAVLMAGQDVDKDEKKAAEYWRMAAAQRFPPAMLNVAKLYVEGTVLPKDLKKARELLKATETLGGSWADEAKAGLAALDELETGGKGEKGGCSVM